MDARQQVIAAAAAGRAQLLLEVLSREHTSEQLHRCVRAVQQELSTIVGAVGEHPPVRLPGKVRPSGEQLDLTT